MAEKQDFRKNPALAGELSALSLCRVYPASVVSAGGLTLALGRRAEGKFIVARDAAGNGRALAVFRGRTAGGRRDLLLCPADRENLRALAGILPWLKPVPGGTRASVGFGDRLGLASAGQVSALGESGLFPFLAQQSTREMDRTGRDPEQVMEDAVRGVFEAGWDRGFGADADHLKTARDIRECAAAGFVMFTIDPGEKVREEADRLPEAELDRLFAGARFEHWTARPAELLARYAGRPVSLEGKRTLEIDESTVRRAMVKYGGAIDRVIELAAEIRRAAAGRPFEIEISVDETESPTSPAEHFLVASELAEAGVEWVGLAPRFPGRFEKGVDYIGDAAAFEHELLLHRLVARRMGDYKLSIHSGSDKFSIYPAIARACAGRFHLKTAGTSYLEALRTIGRTDPDLFREIYLFARQRYPEDRASYHVSASLERVPEDPGPEPAAALDSFDCRQVLHVTFGSVLTARDERCLPLFRERLARALLDSEAEHYRLLAAHLARHVAPFTNPGGHPAQEEKP